MFKVYISSIVLLLTFDSIKAQAAQGSCTKLQLSPVMSATFTPFKTNGDLYLDVIPKYAQYCKDNGIVDVLISAYDGEASLMNVCDRIALIRAWVEAASPLGIGVLVQITGGLPVNESLILAELCVELKVKAIFIIPETIYIPQTVDEAIADILLIAKVAVGIPIVYEDITALQSVGVVSPVEIFVAAVAQVPCFAGFLTNINTALNMKAFISIADKVIIIGGHQYIKAAIQLNFLAMDSAINLFPGDGRSIAAAVQAKDLVAAEELQAILNVKVAAVIGDGDPIKRMKARAYIINQKAACELITGLKTSITRPPLQMITEEVVNQIAKALKALGVILVGTVAGVLSVV